MERDAEPTPDQNSPPPPDRIKQFECKVCIEIANEPVVTLCGHLFW
jgi:hypothetical protein